MIKNISIGMLVVLGTLSAMLWGTYLGMRVCEYENDIVSSWVLISACASGMGAWASACWVQSFDEKE